MAYRCTCNAFFWDLPVSSFMFHSSLLTVKSVNLVVALDGFLCVTRNCLYFSYWLLFNTKVLFQHFLIRTACNESNIADRKGQWIPYRGKFSWDVNFAKSSKIGFSRFYIHETLGKFSWFLWDVNFAK